MVLRDLMFSYSPNGDSVTTIGGVRSRGADAADRRLAVQRAENTKRFLRKQGLQGIVNITSGKTTDTTYRARRVISVLVN